MSRDHGQTWSTPIMIAPPGVHEVNFPTIVAGDPGRIALLFPGSGTCGPGRCDADDGGSMFDFLDIQVSPADGMLWGTASDTCVGECVTNPNARKLRPGEGVAIRQLKGPPLFLFR